MNRSRTRIALAAVPALPSSPTGFTVADLATKARAMAGLVNGRLIVSAGGPLRVIAGGQMKVDVS